MVPRRWRVLVALALGSAACGGGGDSSDAGADAMPPPARWECTGDWIAGERGGCLPPVFASVEGEHFAPAADGGIAGPWIAPGEPDGPPAADWMPDVPEAIAAEGWEPDVGFDTCPEGWVPDGRGACDPQIRDDCPEGSYPLPGGRCTDTATADCPAGDFAELPADAGGATPLHVLEGADASVADGSADKPFATIGDAVEAAADGAWILVGSGSYTENVQVTGELHLVGACPSRVTLVAPGVVDRPLLASGPTALLDARGMALELDAGSARAIEGGRLELRRIVARGHGAHAVRTFDRGSSVELHEVALLGDGPSTADGRLTTALQLGVGGQGMVRGLYVDRPVQASVDLVGSASLTLEDALLVGPEEGRGGSHIAIGAATPASAVIERVVAVRGVRAALFVLAAEHEIRLTDFVAQDTRSPDDEAGGPGLYVGGGATVTASRVLVDSSAAAAVLALGPGTTIEADRFVARNTTAIDSGRSAIEVVDGAEVELSHALVEDNGELGVGVLGAGTILRLTDAIVRRTRARIADLAGQGVTVTTGASLDGTRVLVDDNERGGVVAEGAGTTVELRESVVRATRPTGSRSEAIGAQAQSGAELRLSRSIVEDNVGVGVAALDGTAHLDEVLVRRTQRATDGLFGRGLQAQEGGGIEADRVRVEASHQAAVAALGAGSSVTLRDAVASDTRIGGAEEVLGAGLVGQDGGRVGAERVRVQGMVGAAVFAQRPGGEVTLDASAIRGGEPSGQGFLGSGAVAQLGGEVVLRRTTVEGASGVAALAQDSGSAVRLDGSRVRATRPLREDGAAVALLAQVGAHVEAVRTVLEDHVEFAAFGISFPDEPTSMLSLEDVIATNIEPSRRGMGTGAMVYGGARLQARRLAITRAHGAALGSLSESVRPDGTFESGPSAGLVDDLYVSTTRSSRIENELGEPEATGLPVAYGMHVADGASLRITGALLEGGGYGFYAAGGELRIERGLIRRQLDAAGATSGGTDLSLERVRIEDNARDTVIEDATLPEATALPPPTPVDE